MNLSGEAPAALTEIDPKHLEAPDRWILTRYHETIKGVTGGLETYDLGLSAQKIYDFAWSEFCDWYIEMAKPRLSDPESAPVARAVLYHVLIGLLKLLHPFMPFITDEVYHHLPGCDGSIMVSGWPAADGERDFPEDAQRLEGVMDIIRAVRNLRAEMNVAAGRKARLIVRPREGAIDWRSAIASAETYFKRLASVSALELIGEGDPNPDKSASAVTGACQLYMPLGDLVDVDKELVRLGKDRDAAIRDIARGEAMLQNEGFLSKAPAQLIENEKAKLENLPQDPRSPRRPHRRARGAEVTGNARDAGAYAPDPARGNPSGLPAKGESMTQKGPRFTSSQAKRGPFFRQSFCLRFFQKADRRRP